MLLADEPTLTYHRSFALRGQSTEPSARCGQNPGCLLLFRRLTAVDSGSFKEDMLSIDHIIHSRYILLHIKNTREQMNDLHVVLTRIGPAIIPFNKNAP